MATDILGQELVPGDLVVFVASGYCHRVRFDSGTFKGVHKNGGYQIETRWSWDPAVTRITTLKDNRVAKINPPKPVWQWLGTHETSSSRK